MTESGARILNEAEQLSPTEREELADRLVESVARDVPPTIEEAHLTEVRRRIGQMESGRASLVSGEEAMKQVRWMVSGAIRSG